MNDKKIRCMVCGGDLIHIHDKSDIAIKLFGHTRHIVECENCRIGSSAETFIEALDKYERYEFDIEMLADRE